MPFNSASAEPNSISDLGERQDMGEVEITKQDDNDTLDELMRMLDFLNKDVNTLVQKCLNEFKPLFMGVY